MRITPPAIYHDPERPNSYHKMVNDMAANIHLRDQARRLLIYYGEQFNGFRPAKKTVSNNIGIPIDDVDRVRKQLVNHGLIYYLPRQCLIIRWDRIAIYAMLDKPITNARLSYFRPANEGLKPNRDKSGIRFPRIKDMPEFQTLTVKNDCLNDNQRCIMDRLESMTIDEYYDWLSLTDTEEREEGAA